MTRLFLVAAVMGAALTTAIPASSQSPEPVPASTPDAVSRWDFRVSTGSLHPTGAQRDAFRRGSMTAAQLSFLARPAVAVTATLGWARIRDAAAADDPKLDVFTYDLGAELRAPHWSLGSRVAVRPFAGLGAGARSYNHRGLEVDATHHAAAYGSLGAELGIGPVHLRLEARDYVTRFRPLMGGGRSEARNDVVTMAGLRLAL